MMCSPSRVILLSKRTSIIVPRGTRNLYRELSCFCLCTDAFLEKVGLCGGCSLVLHSKRQNLLCAYITGNISLFSTNTSNTNNAGETVLGGCFHILYAHNGPLSLPV